jgi:hypothetical protein
LIVGGKAAAGGGSTWAIERLAVAYAKWISHEFPDPLYAGQQVAVVGIRRARIE